MRKCVSLFLVLTLALMIGLSACAERQESSDGKQAAQQEVLNQAATSTVGMPAIKNFRERKLLKMILEMRDQESLVTYTYIFSHMSGKLVYIGQSIGFGIPYSTQFTNPQKIADSGHQYGYAILPQADPNGLYSPATAEGTYVLMKDPNSNDVRPVYFEERIIVSPFKLH